VCSDDSGKRGRVENGKHSPEKGKSNFLDRRLSTSSLTNFVIQELERSEEIRNTMQKQREESEEEVAELNEFLQVEKAALTDSLREAEIEVSTVIIKSQAV